jgi:DNA-binding CsgD family transcriptional regulator
VPSLTAREAAVFELLGLGHDNRSIARILGISERTAKRHVTAILVKLRLESRLQAGLAAMIVALTAPPEISYYTVWPGDAPERLSAGRTEEWVVGDTGIEPVTSTVSR